MPKEQRDDEDEQTALHFAVWTANLNAAEQLLAAGADPYILNKLGRNPRVTALSLRQQATRTKELESYSVPSKTYSKS